MDQAIFCPPRRGESARAWKICCLVSLLLHGLALCAPALPTPANFVKRPESGVSIDLEMLADAKPAAAQTETASPPRQMAQERATDPAKIVGQTPQPVPKKTTAQRPKPAPEKAETRTPEPKKTARAQKTAPAKAPRGGRLVAGSVSPIAPAKTADGPPIPPAPVGGASSPRPPYPELARKRGQEGTVNVRCEVDSAGKVISVSLAKSSGFKLLDDAALKALGKWKFRPARKDGSSVAGAVIVPVQFRLQ